jgi:hypothetical protein
LTRPGTRYRLRPIGGGASDPDDTALIVNAITDAALCLGCITKRLGVPATEAQRVLGVIRRTVRLTQRGQCSACLEHTAAFTLDGQDGDHSRGVPPPRNGIILQFLEQRRGQAFCSQCIAATLFVGKPVDYALRQLEGLGPRREHGVCSTCGKPRLVIGLRA